MFRGCSLWLKGTPTLYSPRAFVIASNPRNSTEAGLLVSAPIGCQLSGGEVTFKHWISRARNGIEQPHLSVCWRKVDEETLQDCKQITDASPGPSSYSIPGPNVDNFQAISHSLP